MISGKRRPNEGDLRDSKKSSVLKSSAEQYKTRMRVLVTSMRRRLLLAAIFGFLALGGLGCEAIPLAMLGTIAGAAGSAASAGREVFALGKLDTAEQVEFEQAVAAARQTAADLGLHLAPPKHDCRKKDPTVEELHFLDDKRAKLSVRLDRRAPRLVMIRIDVGWFGKEVTAHLFLTRLRAHLPPPEPRASHDHEPQTRP